MANDNAGYVGSLNTVYLSPSEISSTIVLHQRVDDQDAELKGFRRLQLKLRRVVEHLAFRILGFLLILADIVIMIVDVTDQNSSLDVHSPVDITTLCFVCYFFLEVNVRLLALGPKQFATLWYNIIDYVIVVISFIVTIVCASIEEVSEYAKLVIVGRLVRVVIFVRLLTERKQLEAGARHLVSQNKRRYQKDGFDLDLTYVTDRVIAMSFPSSGRMAMYRNPIKEVARFFDLKHGNHYRVYNLCKERCYDSKYFHGFVEHFPIEDHNPPTLEELFQFTKSVKEWFDRDPANVIAVHCKGGKGRTGTMIAAWLIESGSFESAMESLMHFGSRRTDFSLGSKYQGVGTPSQNRYVWYYFHIKNRLDGHMPEEVELKLEKIRLWSLKGVGKGDGTDFYCEIWDGSDSRIFSCEFSRSTTIAEVFYNATEDYFEALLIDGPHLKDDIKLVFYCSSKSVPCDSKGVTLFFWFHTAFVRDCRLILKRDELDYPHKPKTWKTFKENFKVELIFSNPLNY